MKKVDLIVPLSFCFFNFYCLAADARVTVGEVEYLNDKIIKVEFYDKNGKEIDHSSSKDYIITSECQEKTFF